MEHSQQHCEYSQSGHRWQILSGDLDDYVFGKLSKIKGLIEDQDEYEKSESNNQKYQKCEYAARVLALPLLYRQDSEQLWLAFEGCGLWNLFQCNLIDILLHFFIYALHKSARLIVIQFKQQYDLKLELFMTQKLNFYYLILQLKQLLMGKYPKGNNGPSSDKVSKGTAKQNKFFSRAKPQEQKPQFRKPKLQSYKEKPLKKQQPKIQEQRNAQENSKLNKHMQPVVQKKQEKVQNLQGVQDAENEKSKEKVSWQERAKIKARKHNRIIIRNLIVDINQKHLKKLLSPYGQVKEVNIPMHPDKNISKGFAFVQFATKNQCHNAINKLNGTNFKGRTIILDFSLAKSVYLDEKLNSENIEKGTEEKIQNQQNELKNEQNSKEQMQNQDEEDQEQQEQVKQEPKRYDEKHVQDLSSSIFIRNLATSVSDQDLYNHFKKYGKIKYARVVMDPETKLSKGSGIVKFLESQPAKQLVQQSRSYQLLLAKKLRHFEPNPKINLQIDGKIVKIFECMSRSSLETKISQRKPQENNKQSKKAIPIKKVRSIERLAELDKNNKRNLNLALQGVWRAQEQMNKHDYQKFKNHERQKLERLKNPNYFVSMTRVILKGMDKKVEQSKIREVAYAFLDQKNLKHKNLTYCKLMLDKDMKKSAGYAFLQFSKHQHSLDFINYVKENSERVCENLFICEFAIEDSRKLLKKGKKITKKMK